MRIKIVLAMALILFLSLFAYAADMKAEIFLDRYGIPHIYAQNDEDALFAFGYVQAKDRMFMMDAMRRVAKGSLSEIMGPFLLAMDKKYIVYDFEGSARKQWEKMPEGSRKRLYAFIRGINHAIETNAYSDFLYKKLNITPQLFTPTDSLAVTNFVSFFLAESVNRKMMMLELVEKIGREEAEAILGMRFSEALEQALRKDEGSKPADYTFTVPDMLAWIPRFGSNNWVIHPSKTSEGASMLTNDPHVPFQQPSLFYEAHIKTPTWEIYGVTIPTAPAVALGFTPYVSFGGTVTWADVMDLVLMKWDAEKKKVFDGKSWVPVTVEERPRTIKGGKPVQLQVFRTSLGPILKTRGSHAVVMRWSFDESPGDIVAPYQELLAAKNLKEAQKALAKFSPYSANMVIADHRENIGYQMTGKIPIRKGPQHLFHVPYMAGEVEWTGFIPERELLSIENPKEGFVYTANHNFFQSMPYSLSNYFDPGYRAKRIEKLLREKKPLDRKAMENMMSDDASLLAQDFLPLILSQLKKMPMDKTHPALASLDQWDGRCDVDSVACSWFHVIVQVLLEKVFKETMGPVYPAFLEAKYVAIPRLLAYMKGEIKSGKLPQNITKVVDEAVQEAWNRLVKLGSGDIPPWGKVHQVVFANPFDLLGLGLSVGPYPMAGGLFGVGRADWDLNKPFTASFGAPFRMVVVMENPVRAYVVLAPGEHENPNDTHGKDQVELWLKGTLRPVLLDKADIQKPGGEKLELKVN